MNTSRRWRIVSWCASQFGDGDALDQLHYEIRAAGVGDAGVVDGGDVGVVHQPQGFALSLEPRDDLFGVHP
jgi:hypothetical protein